MGVSLPSVTVSQAKLLMGGLFNVETTNEATALPPYQGKKLSDFYTSQGAVLVDAFLAANLAGGPTARPEDLEVHPETKEVFIAYTDGAQVMDIPILESLWPSTAVPSTPDSLPGTLQNYRRQLRWHGYDLPLAAIC